MNCKELVELVTDYLEGKLPSVETVRFEQHLSTCDGCTNYVAQIRQTIRVVGSLRRDALTTRQWQDLMKIFRDWRKD
jgi:anti-sigma factor RsiW